MASEINIQIGETGLEKKDKNKVIRTKWMRKILKMKKDETEEKLGMTDPRWKRQDKLDMDKENWNEEKLKERWQITRIRQGQEES